MGVLRMNRGVALAGDATLDDLREALKAEITRRRDARIRQGFVFGAHRYDYDDDSQKRITGAAALAGFAMVIGGKEPTDLYWHGGGEPFTWIAQDNALVQMGPLEVFGLGQAAAAWETDNVFAAKALKNRADAATNAATLDAIDLNAGWPE